MTFSNLLAYYFEYDKAIFRKFIKGLFDEIDDFSSQFKIMRESDNIDLLISDNKYVIVIENKIKSGINGIKDDNAYSQLNTYQSKIEERIKNPEDDLYGRQSYYCIFTPNYNHIDTSEYKLKKSYKIITYKELYNFFCNNAANYVDDRHFSDFLKGLERHTVSSIAELNFNIMRSRFFEKINNI